MRRTAILLALVLIAGACSNLGLGEAHCSLEENGDVSPTNILSVQAVPTAKYVPCLNELRLGWDSVSRFARDGEAGISISRAISPFLTATVSESCAVPADARLVESGYPDIRRFEDIESEPVDIGIVIIPSGERPLSSSVLLVDDFSGTEIDDRPVMFTLDGSIDEPVSSRSNLALARHDFVWIIDEIDSEEGTVELRSNYPTAVGHGLLPGEAAALIEDVVPEVFYEGNWYFNFEGGCITYEFDAKGTLAETVAADAEEAFGFYPAGELREFAREQGFTIE